MVRIIVIVLLSFPSFLFGQSEETKEEPSLVELAQRQREQRQETAQPVRLITNEDLGNMQSARVATTRSSGSRGRRRAIKESQEGAEAEVGEGEEPDTSTVEYWEPIFKEAVEALKYAANASLVLELRINNFQNAYFNEEDGVRRQAVNAELAKTAEELIEARGQEQEARDRIVELQKEAGKAGLTPGEIRKLTGKLPAKRSIMELPDLNDPALGR